MSKINYLPLIEKVIVNSDRLDIKINPILKQKYVLDDFWLKIKDTNLNDIPMDILLIPFILNIAPVIWISGLKFEMESMDAELSDSLVKLKRVLSEMYPNCEWNGELKINNTTTINHQKVANNSVLLFSGGLDSVASSYRHLDEKQTLVTVCGSDILLDDIEGWEIVQNATIDFAKTIGIDYYFVESNFKNFLNHKELSNLAKVPTWWGYIQHGMGLSGLMAIPGWLSGSINGYIASSHSQEFYDIRWGSHPKIDNHIKWVGLKVTHDCYNLTRQDKIELVVNKVLSGTPTPFLRVCYSSLGGKNCGLCEKCCRTMNGLLVTGVNFREYGFVESDSELMVNTRKIFSSQKFKLKDTLFQWQDIQAGIKNNQYYIDKEYSKELLDYIEWLRAFDFKEYKVKQEKKNLLRQKRKKLTRFFTRPFSSLKSRIKA